MRKRNYYRPKVPNSPGFEVHAREAGGAAIDHVPIRGQKQMAVYIPTVEKLQNNIADEFFQWALLPDSMQIKKFFYSRGMSYDDFKKKTKDNEYCKMIHKTVRDIIADKLQHGWQTRELDGNYAQFYARLYDQDYIDMTMQLKAAAVANAQSSTTVQYVVLPEIPDSPEVKERS